MAASRWRRRGAPRAWASTRRRLAGRRARSGSVTTWQGWWRDRKPSAGGIGRLVEEWFRDSDIQHFLSVNRFEGTLWYNKEAFQDLVTGMTLVMTIDMGIVDDGATIDTMTASKDDWLAGFSQVLLASDKAGYRIDRLLAALLPSRRHRGAGDRVGSSLG